ncbi:beta-N-acetylglucosaminidase domain-containing protein [Sphingobacterium oryzagri]|uniref:Beta-N-acetylglucosaminidase domain-containing protein n=1 Tax=Sphingobacterium oryzagri TaxID=3025669 RepID=A0ABY7WCC0_9SPHI|nr:beta-N-acetylglucosaminidase domain-containing protein [Sphingobacterium sp. KACC 22765]WDF67312.1 beta-N-acetylglucosaminidase domain-containing protein [Sphingobacterium sp. KACC 22765]
MKYNFKRLLIVIAMTPLLSGSIAFAQSSPGIADANDASLLKTSTLPAIFPTPVSIELKKGNIALGKSVVLLSSAKVGAETKNLIEQILKNRGVKTIKTAKKLPKHIDDTYIVMGTQDEPAVLSALAQFATKIDSNANAYTIASKAVGEGALITLAGKDAEGLYYAAQTFGQIARRAVFPALVIHDYPALPIRGTIEGFYGKPWTMQERENHIKFLASVKANTFIYSPKDDPYARDRWREPYPAETLKSLKKLAAVAKSNHINFVYAISPGPTVCFADADDLRTLLNKFQALRAAGIHSFYVALDDIEYTKWNCALDSVTFGPSGAEAAARAQAHLLNAVQADMKKVDPTAPPLIMVPTEYYDAKETPYKAALRKHLDPQIVVQWTGTDVVPPAISINDARAATKAFGRKTFLWDNYPVNDYHESAGRLLLAPYTRREAGLSQELSGIVSNPMNQEVASRIAVTGLLAFAWNDRGYDAEPTWQFAARELAHDNKEVTKALLTFFDTQRLAPTFGTHPWQAQSPKLKTLLDEVTDVIANANVESRTMAIDQLAKYAVDFEQASAIIRNGVVDAAFTAEARPWLDAMQLWGKALQATAAGLRAANQADAAAKQHFDQAAKLAAEATAIQSIPGATRFEGPVKIADGVLDRFIIQAPKMIVF